MKAPIVHDFLLNFLIVNMHARRHGTLKVACPSGALQSISIPIAGLYENVTIDTDFLVDSRGCYKRAGVSN